MFSATSPSKHHFLTECMTIMVNGNAYSLGAKLANGVIMSQ